MKVKLNFIIYIFLCLLIKQNAFAFADKNAFVVFENLDNQKQNTYQKLLQKYVDAQGRVNYKAFKKEHHKLKNVLKEYSETNVAGLSKNGQLAFWINVYNAATIDIILENYPLKSIKDIANGKVWDKKLSFTFNQENLSLNEIEHKKLLTQFKDARIHFAINCASISCPPLSNKPFTAENVQQQLQALTSKFLNEPKFTLLTNKVKISPLFKWYANDFEKNNGSVIAFINHYTKAKKIEAHTTIDYLDYNWNLNAQ